MAQIVAFSAVFGSHLNIPSRFLYSVLLVTDSSSQTLSVRLFTRTVRNTDLFITYSEFGPMQVIAVAGSDLGKVALPTVSLARWASTAM